MEGAHAGPECDCLCLLLFFEYSSSVLYYLWELSPCAQIHVSIFLKKKIAYVLDFLAD